MSMIEEGILEVVADPEYQEAMNKALQEIRENVAELGRDEALKRSVQMNYLLATIRPDVVATMATVVMFDLAKLTDPAQQE